jgi:hypothetical protein
MAKYRVNGQVYNLPDDVTPERAMELIQSNTGGASNSPSATNSSPANPGEVFPQIKADPSTQVAGLVGPEDKIDPDTLSQDQDWLDSANRLYRFNNPGEFQGSARDLAEYGLDQMGWFNYNLPTMGVDAARLRSADESTKAAFVHLMDKYDNLEMSWGGAGRFVKGAVLDPTNYIGLASLGIGTVASSGAKVMTKQGIKELLKAGLVGAVDAGVIMGTQDAVGQSVRLDAGTQKEFSYGELAGSAAVGAVGGEILGAGARGITKGLGKELVGTATRDAKISAEGALADAQAAVHGASGTPVAAGAEKAAGEAPRAPVQPANDNTPLDIRQTGEQQVGTGNIVFKDGKLVPPGERDAVLASDAIRAKAANDPVAEPKAFDPNTKENPGAVANTNDIPLGSPNAPNTIIAAINKYALDTGARVFAKGEQLAADTAEAIKVITNLKPDEAKAVVSDARMGKFGPEGTMMAKKAFADGTQKLGEELKANRKALDLATKAKEKDFKVIGELQRRANDLQKVYDVVRDVDKKFSSITGHELQDRVGNTNVGDFRDVSPDSIIKDKFKLEPALIGEHHPIRREAEAQFQRMLDEHKAKLDSIESVRTLEAEADDLMSKGDTAGAIRKSNDAHAIRSQMAKDEAAANPKTWMAGLSEAAHSGWLKAVEYVISTVFKSSTVLVNLVPHLILTPTRPMVEFMIRGGGAEAYSMMKASYSAMYMHSGEALRAAAASFKYEADLLGAHGADSAGKYLEHGASIKGLKGSIIRFFPAS